MYTSFHNNLHPFPKCTYYYYNTNSDNYKTIAQEFIEMTNFNIHVIKILQNHFAVLMYNSHQVL